MLETRLVDSSLVNFLLAVIVYKVFRRVPELSFSLSIIVFNLISFGCSGQSVLSSPLEREWIKKLEDIFKIREFSINNNGTF